MDELSDRLSDRLSERLAGLTPQQRELLALRARKRRLGLQLPGEGPGEGPPEPGAGEARRSRPSAVAVPVRPAAATEGELQFSLFFFSDEGSWSGGDKYRLLLESARFADRRGFAAIWTPERHFVDFGGLYPNPSVLSAALAAITERLAIRAGSLVLPLHHPVRVVEDWSLIDNLSGGRVGLSFASGWHPRDFALAPSAYADRREILFRDLEIVRRLWRQGSIRVPGVDGEDVELRVLPRPLQPELPVWITSSGSVATWVRAGEVGANILAALSGDPAVDLAHRIALYRRARRENGHDPAAGCVTLMLHTYLGHDLGAVRERVRAPMTRYLRTFLAQGKDLDLRGLGLEAGGVRDRDVDDLAAFAFARYFDERSLLGTPESCLPRLELLRRVGVDEVACLVDFGLAPEWVLAGLEPLAELRDEHRRRAARAADAGAAGAAP